MLCFAYIDGCLRGSGLIEAFRTLPKLLISKVRTQLFAMAHATLSEEETDVSPWLWRTFGAMHCMCHPRIICAAICARIVQGLGVQMRLVRSRSTSYIAAE